VHVEPAKRPPKREPRRERPAAEPRASAGVRERPSPAEEIDYASADPSLVGALKTLRSAIAREEKVPAYVVFPDRTLVEMAVRRPRSLVALADVRGVGPAKLEKYGERFLAIIRGANDTEAA
jgi:ATP-dependent DNA helicase RecQ